MTDEAEAEQPQPHPPGYVPSEGRTIRSPEPKASDAFAAFLNHQLGYTR